MRLPTVTLKRPSDGKVVRVNRAEYAVNLGAYARKGYRLQTEARGETSDRDMEFEIKQAEIEAERQITREAPKNYEARKIEVRPAVEPDPAAKEPDAEPQAAADEQSDEPVADSPPPAKRPSTRTTRGRRKAS